MSEFDHEIDVMTTHYKAKDVLVFTNDKLPRRKFDGVVCVNIMQDIPEENIDQILKKIYSKAKKFVFFGIGNCDNPHTLSWWREKIHERATVPTFIRMSESQEG